MKTSSSICLRCNASIEAGAAACPKCGEGLATQGSRLGPYRLVRLISSSPNGRVHRAMDEKNNRIVALKVFFELSKRDEQRFRRQAQLITKLKHPHLLPILDFGTLVGEVVKFAYVALPFVEGSTLDCAPGSLKDKLRICADIAGALDHAHREGVVHRDVKPSNILVNGRGHGYITDFGIAKDVRETSTQITVTGSIVGTPHFMSPEQARGEQNIGPPADIYSLGATVYNLATGHLPFETSGSTMQIVRRVATEPPPTPSKVAPDIDPELERIITTAMKAKPEERYESAAALATALRDHAGGRRATRRQKKRPAAPAAPSAHLEAEADVRLDAAERRLALYETTDRDMGEEDLRQIEQGIEAAMKICPGHVRASICRGRLELVRGNHEAAIRAFDAAIERQPDSSTGYGYRLKARARSYARLRGVLIVTLGESVHVQTWRRERDEARELRAAITSDLRMLERTHGGADDARQQFATGFLLLYEGRFGDAARALEEAAPCLGVEPDVWRALGAARVLQGRHAEGGEAFKRMNSIRRSSAGLRLQAISHLLLAWDRHEKGEDPIPEMAESVRVSDAAAVMDPENPSAARLAGNVHRMFVILKSMRGLATLEDFENLVREVDRIIAARPKDPVTRQLLPASLETCASRYEGDPERREGWIDRAIEECRRGISLDPTYRIARSNLPDVLLVGSRVHRDAGRRKELLEQALEAADQAIKLGVQIGKCYGFRALALHGLERPAEAREAARKALRRKADAFQDDEARAIAKKLLEGG